jgi:hypothetical protein
MKTILVVYTNQKLPVEQINNCKMQKYCFRTENEVEVGDVLKSKSYTSNMIVTDVVDADFKYYNAQSGEMTNTINSTKCYPIKTLVLREEDENVIYAAKVTNNEKA